MSIRGRILAVVTAFTIVLSLLVTAVSYRVFSKVIVSEYEKNLTLTAKHYAALILLSMTLNRDMLLEKAAEGLLRNRSVIGFEVRDADGKILFSKGKKTGGHIEIPLISLGKRESLLFGNANSPKRFLVIYYSNEPIRKLLAKLILKVSTVVLFALVCVVVAIHYVISRSVLNPLMQLVESAKKVSEGDLDVETSLCGVDEVDRLSRAFNEMIQSIKHQQALLEKTYESLSRHRVFAEIGKFSLAIAHEIKNPLGVIKGALNLLKKKEVPEDVKKQMFSYIEEETVRLDRLVRDFLKLSKVKPPKYVKVDVMELVHSVVGKMGIENDGVSFRVNNKLADSVVLSDPDKLERIMANLIRNAIEAGATEIEIELFDNGKGGWGFSVRDNGPGIGREEMDKIFEPFYTKKKDGTGLGLTIVAQEVVSMDGDIELESEKGKGCTFKVRLPKRGSGYGTDTCGG